MVNREMLEKIKAVHGKPLTLFAYLVTLGGSATETKLSTISGYTPKTIRGHLKTLSLFGHVRKMRKGIGYILTREGRQFSFDLGLDRSMVYITGNYYRLHSLSSSIKDSLTILSSLYMINRLVNNKVLKETTTIPRPTGNNYRLANHPAFDILRSSGIINPALDRLLALPHVSLEYARAHCLKFEEDLKRLPGKLTIGALIYRIENNIPAPAVKIICDFCPKEDGTHAIYCTHNLDRCADCGLGGPSGIHGADCSLDNKVKIDR